MSRITPNPRRSRGKATNRICDGIFCQGKNENCRNVTTSDIEAIHAEAGVKHPYAANRLVEIVRKMFNWAQLAGYVPKSHPNPAVALFGFQAQAPPIHHDRRDARFVEALDQEDNDYARHAIWLLLLTGLRCKELLKAKWKDIDWDRGTLFIGLTKNGDPLLSPLTDEALDSFAHSKDFGQPLHNLWQQGAENILLEYANRCGVS